jgi:CubicO group peptidase (beta-lactamase class C family)
MIRKITKIMVLIGILATGFTGNAQELPRVAPGAAGLSAQRLERLDDMLNGHIQKGELAGTVVLIARHGKVAFFKSYGLMDIEAQKPMPLDGIFRIASMTKVATAVSVLILYEEGRFLLNDPVAKYLPEFRVMKVLAPGPGPKNGTTAGQGKNPAPQTEPAARPITIRDLLRHTSGLVYSDGGTIVDQEYIEAGFRTWGGTLAEFVEKIAQLPLVSQPGTQFHYSYSFDILGHLVEVISGQPLDEFMKQRIFQPLGMPDTDFYVPPGKLNRFANYYLYEKGKLRLEEPANRSDFRKKPRAFSGGGGWWSAYGGLVTTARDYSRLLQMLLNGGKLGNARILSRKSVELMTANHLAGIPQGRGPGEGYGLGVGIVTDTGKYGEISSSGTIYWAGAPYNTFFFVDIKEEMLGILLTQTAPWEHVKLMDRFGVVSVQAIDD